MKRSRYWPLAILLLGLAGCSGSPSASGGKGAAELIARGNEALARGDLDEALAAFNAAMDAQADSAQARERRGATFLRMKKFDQALYDCNEALKIDGKLASAYFTRGVAEKNLGEPDKALKDFTKALDCGLERADVLADRGGLYHCLAKACVRSDEAAKYLQQALKDFNRAVKLDPRQAGLRMQRAAVHLDLGDYESAVPDCDAALEADLNLAAAYVARARGECELGEIEKAITDCDSAVHLDETLMEAYVLRARARLENASEMRTVPEVALCGQAVDDCQKAIGLAKKFKGDAEGMKHAKAMHGLAHELRGSIYQNLRATKKASAEYERALEMDPYLVTALLRRAVMRSIAEDYHAALSDCNTAISVDSTRADAYVGRGTIYAMKSELPKALEDLTTAVQLNHKCAKAYSMRATVYSLMASDELRKAREAADRKEAAACQEKVKEYQQKCIDDATAAIAANRHLARAYQTRGVAYATQRISDKALADFNAAIREDPKMAIAYGNRGALFFNAGHWDEAIADFTVACKLHPDNIRFRNRLGQCYQQKGDLISAADCFKKARGKIDDLRHDVESSFGESADFVFKPKKVPDPRLDSESDPLEEAKRELGKKLDATAER